MRFARTSTIFALPCDVSVTMPACEPVSEIASWPEVVDGHRRQRAGDALADGDQHVELAGLRPRGHLVGERDEIVGRVAHRREHGDDALTLFPRRDDPLGDGLQSLGVGDRRAAELHDERAGGGVLGLAGDGWDGLVFGRGHASIVGSSGAGVSDGIRPQRAAKDRRTSPPNPFARRTFLTLGAEGAGTEPGQSTPASTSIYPEFSALNTRTRLTTGESPLAACFPTSRGDPRVPARR